MSAYSIYDLIDKKKVGEYKGYELWRNDTDEVLNPHVSCVAIKDGKGVFAMTGKKGWYEQCEQRVKMSIDEFGDV